MLPVSDFSPPLQIVMLHLATRTLFLDDITVYTMPVTTDLSPSVTFRLITDHSKTLNHHCSICQFFHSSDQHCEHKMDRPPAPRSHSHFSDYSYYSAVTRASTPTTLPSVSTKPSTISLRGSRQLRRKTSPTEVSLRELRAKHAHQSLLRAKKSEEELQRVYEMQILAYLEGPCVSLDNVSE